MKTTSRLRIGLIGLGSHGSGAVLPAIGHSSFWELAAVADCNAALLEAAPHAHRYPSLEAMLKEETLDAVYIATLPDTHHALTLTALQHGLHVVCEKPLAATLEEASAMNHAAREAGRQLVVMFESRFHDYNRTIREWITSGRLGRVEAIHLQTLGKHPTAQPRRTNLLNAAGCLDCGIHKLDLVRYWNNGALWEKIHALGAWFDEEVERPPHLGILARLDNGVMVTFEDSFSFGYRLPQLPNTFRKNHLAIVGTHGLIIDDGPESYQLITEAGSESVAAPVSHHQHEIPKVLDAFALTLRQQEQEPHLLPTGEDGLEAQRILEEVCAQAIATRYRRD